MQAHEIAAGAKTELDTGPSASHHRDYHRIATIMALRLGLVVALLGFWQLAATRGWVAQLYVSKPTAIASALGKGLGNGSLLNSLWGTLFEMTIGFGISAVIGLVAGLLLYSSPLLNDVLRPLISAVNSLPRLALAPLFVLWLGLGSASRIALIVTLVVFIIMLTTYAGLQSASRDHLILAKTLGANRRTLFQKFVLPAAVPTIFAGFQLGITYSFLGAVIGEMLSGSTGVGARLALTISTFNTADFFAALFMLMVVATVLATAVRAVEKRLLHWQKFEFRGNPGAS